MRTPRGGTAQTEAMASTLFFSQLIAGSALAHEHVCVVSADPERTASIFVRQARAAADHLGMPHPGVFAQTERPGATVTGLSELVAAQQGRWERNAPGRATPPPWCVWLARGWNDGDCRDLPTARGQRVVAVYLIRPGEQAPHPGFVRNTVHFGGGG